MQPLPSFAMHPLCLLKQTGVETSMTKEQQADANWLQHDRVQGQRRTDSAALTPPTRPARSR